MAAGLKRRIDDLDEQIRRGISDAEGLCSIRPDPLPRDFCLQRDHALEGICKEVKGLWAERDRLDQEMDRAREAMISAADAGDEEQARRIANEIDPDTMRRIERNERAREEALSELADRFIDDPEGAEKAWRELQGE